MAVPKRKQTPSRTGMRRAQTMKFSTKNIVEDKKSGEYRLSHHLDLKTGMYKGCLLYTSPSPRDVEESRMPSSA